jgi:hypothetical protein
MIVGKLTRLSVEKFNKSTPDNWEIHHKVLGSVPHLVPGDRDYSFVAILENFDIKESAAGLTRGVIFGGHFREGHS